MRSLISVRRNCTCQLFLLLLFLYVSRAGVHSVCVTLIYFILVPGCVIGLVLLSCEQLQYELMFCMCCPAALPALFLLLGASLCCGHNGVVAEERST